MAASPTHRFGQIIGDMLEEAIRPPLLEVAKRHGLYLDWKHARKARGDKKKVAWTDQKGNSHDLDYVLEEGGSEAVLGRPRAFIEIAYRRYTKHSRNKSQEIQGAVTPLAEKYSGDHPFLGAVLAGVFTDGSLNQLKSHGFGVLFFPFDDIVEAFKEVDIDAFFDEDSTDADVKKKVDAYDQLTDLQKNSIASSLRDQRPDDVKTFMDELERTLTRKVERVLILTLHGGTWEVASVGDAIKSITDYNETDRNYPFMRYELNVRYNNGDEIRGNFENKRDAIKFLNSLS